MKDVWVAFIIPTLVVMVVAIWLGVMSLTAENVEAKRVHLDKAHSVWCVVSRTGGVSCDWQGTKP